MIAKILKSIDNGKTCGIYMISLGAVLVISMIFRGILQGWLDFDLSPLFFFLVGYLLINHNNIARKWVIVFSFIGTIVASIGAIITPFIGPNNIKVNLLFYDVQEPSFVTAYIAIFVGLIIFLIPIILLYNEKARQEFADKNL